MINVAAILSIKNWPLTAAYGLSSIFYYVFAAVFFFIPVSFVAAELATGWPERGGIFVWVREALGKKWAFLAVWLLWMENVVYYPTVLTFIAATVAYIIKPVLAESAIYTFVVTISVFWIATLVNLRGMKTSGWISTLGVIIGTFVPGALILFLGLLWLFQGQPLAVDFSASNWIPSFKSPGQLSILAGVMLGLAGMEMSAVHARDVKHPKKDYPKAIFLSAILIIGLSILGTLAISLVIPAGEISLVAGGMEAISQFLQKYSLLWMVPFISILIALGAFGTMSTWLVGPSKGLLAAAKAGEFPPILHKVNKHDMPIALMLFQAVIVSVLLTLFFFVPNVSSSFWMFVVLSSQLYLIMYIMMFVTAIVLKYKKPNVKREYTVPGGKVGMWIIAGIGAVGCLFIFILGFFPPEGVEIENLFTYELFLVGGIIIFCTIPRIILFFKKPSWQEKKAIDS